MLGITSPVDLSITDYWGGATCGRLIGFMEGRWRIGLDTFLSPRQASRTLWHELIHVAQGQRAGGLAELDALMKREVRNARLAGRGQRRWFRGWAYRRMPAEREAEREGRRLHRRLRLARRR
jgi:hypothetical protein